MEWYHMIEILAIPVFSFVGGVVGKKYDLKGKKMELDASENKQIEECKKSHEKDIKDVVNKFTEILGSMQEDLQDIKNKQYEMSFSIEEVKKDQDRCNSAINSIHDIDKRLSVVEDRVS